MIIGRNPSSSGGGGGGLPSGVAQWKKYTVTYNQIQTAATTNGITIVTLPSRTGFGASLIKHSISFLGTGVTSCSMQLNGYGTILNGSLNIFQSVAGNAYQIVDERNSNGYQFGTDITATQAITANFTCNVNLNNLTQGSIDIWLETITLP